MFQGLVLIKVALVVSDRPVATPFTFCKRLLTLLAKAQSVRGSCENDKYPELLPVVSNLCGVMEEEMGVGH